MSRHLETRSVYPVDLELRQDGDRPVIAGAFPYGAQATIASRGRVRKERFEPRAFDFVVNQEVERDVNLLYGHDFNTPLANRSGGTLSLVDGEDALRFEATLPPEGEQPTWVRDALLAHRAGLIRGISPGFSVPPSTAVRNAERFEPEAGNPGVMIRVIRAAVLGELSLVSRPAYRETILDTRADAIQPYWQLDNEMLRWL